MPAGDSTRTWFPSMLDELEGEWSMSLSWTDCADLCQRMTEAREKLKQERGIKSATMQCRHCNGDHTMRLAPITIRSLLFALKKRGLLDETELIRLDADWKRYRKLHRLDAYGREPAEPSSRANSHQPS